MSARDKFAGGTAVVTGAGSGIGEGIARVAASLGMNVVLADVARDRIEQVAADINASGASAIPVVTDVTDIAALERLADAAYNRFGEVTLAVNNAGIETIGFSWEIPDETWDRLLSINVRGVVHGSRIFARRMLESGKPGYIANVASIGALGMMPTQAPYMMSKHAVLSFTECLYLEMQLKKAPIQISAVLPAQVATRIFEDAPADRQSGFVERQREMMHAMITQIGVTPEQAGETILNGIAAGDFWVSTHPDTTAEVAKRRAEYLAALEMPALAEQARVLVEEA
ncbi:NAD(P)-dependent dehydrogenase (short-subunit alcohol dehydrogenase family) [Sphingobium sp. OAS761]|uniref:SDR family NAD(P)-dependent oxidoreductase n=1 Tax=Sphingobium sp. OAS761 TaxID=2817901 RepID=UPI00209DDC72|nr:SDR family NAD(P)-dependent oxidoreductase [Sphingobium sp. OAS761]MCP1471469.1 NAD(P)-dependent dehydrogenase (short-subunit alcohol dehydrogenase family) [Sphingobium sp. OAS761]